MSSSASDDEAQLVDEGGDDEYTQEEWEVIGELDECTSAKSMLKIMTGKKKKVKDDWLQGSEGIDGNIYRCYAFGVLSGQPLAEAGAFGIFLIQLIGPPFVFIHFWGKFAFEKWAFDWTTLWGEWTTLYGTRTLAVIFIFIFILNSLQVVNKEQESWAKTGKVFSRIAGSIPEMSDCGLLLGAFLNLYVIIFICLDTLFVLGAAENPFEVVGGALGLTFLYQLDDIGGGISFFDDSQWPGKQLSWYADSWDENPPDAEVKDTKEVHGAWANCLFVATRILLYLFMVALPVIYAITPFTAMTTAAAATAKAAAAAASAATNATIA